MGTPTYLGPIESLALRDPNRRVVPLGSVADVTFESGPASVNRTHQARSLVVELNVRRSRQGQRRGAASELGGCMYGARSFAGRYP